MYYQHYGVTDVSDKGLDVHGGIDVKYSFDIDGIKYEYLLTGALMTHGDFYSGIKVGFWSVADEAGMSFDVEKSLLHNVDKPKESKPIKGQSYFNLSLGINVGLELNIIGLRAEEAKRELVKYIDLLAPAFEILIY